MDSFIIKGGNKLNGSVEISGAKNAALPLMAASLLAKGKTVLRNVPHISDVKMMAHLLRVIGARVDLDGNTMEIDAAHCSFYEAPYELVKKMRASIYVLGPLLARFGKADVSFPGGCAFGPRPIDLHIEAMKQLDASIEISHGYIYARTERLKGARIFFKKSSVGATGNTLMAAVLAEGQTIIENAAMEPEIDNLVAFLQAMGADIEGIGTTRLVINGVEELKPVEFAVIPDRIEAGTFLAAGAITNGTVTVTNCLTEHIMSLITAFEQCGFKLDYTDTEVTIHGTDKFNASDITTLPYPGFPTDLQAQFMAVMALADGFCSIEEQIYPDRFKHVAELARLGADIRLDNNTAIVKGVKELSGAEVMASDLRASAALVIAGLAASGTTNVSRIYHIDRGYEKIDAKLKQLGADIRRIHA